MAASSSPSFDAFVAAALFPREGPVFALGDGRVVFREGPTLQAHDGPVLCAAPHPSGEGVVTGGDDGRLVWTRPGGAETLLETRGAWIDAVAVSVESGLIACAAGRTVEVLDRADPAFRRSFAHERSVAGLAFDPKGRRIAAAGYGGVQLWYVRIAEQKPQLLKWAGAHAAAAWSPDGRYVVSAMQENALHGWRLADAKDMRMGGYPAKPRGLAFFAKGALLATSGAAGVVVWPFIGSSGPMGREAAEIGPDASALVTQVAAAPATTRIAAGLDDGRVWWADTAVGAGVTRLKAEKGAAISALAVSPDARRVAWGDEDGGWGVADLDG